MAHPTPENRTLFQTFEWHTKSDTPSHNETHSHGSHYARLARLAPSLAGLGLNMFWLPPGCKANEPSGNGNGYDCYDHWDLGEFDQKGRRNTKWGSKEELGDLIEALHQNGVEGIWDAVLNHKTAGDTTMECWAVEVDENDRRVETSAPKKITPWIVYNHDNRGGKYSEMKWRAEHFSGTDWDQRAEKHAIYKIIDDPASFPKPGHEDPDLFKKGMHRISRFFSGKKSDAQSTIAMKRPGKGWAEDVDDLHGNADYLMFSDIDHKHPEVREDLFNWADWMIHENGLDGFRLDAAAHFSYGFARDWIARAHQASQAKRGRDAFIVGEVWTGKTANITRWLDTVGQGAYAYDAPLVSDFARVSKDVVAGSPNADLRTIMRGSLVKERPHNALTLVTNHDTQPGQAAATPIDVRLKSVFYAFILLRAEGLPSVFWGDLYGTCGKEGQPPACLTPSNRSLLPDLIFSRRMYAYGQQTDYFDAQSCIGWTRSGTHDRPGCAVVLSVGPYNQWSTKKMQVGRPGEVWVDVLSDPRQRVEVQIDQTGFGTFYCLGWSPAVYVRIDSPGLQSFPVRHDLNCYQQ